MCNSEKGQWFVNLPPTAKTMKLRDDQRLHLNIYPTVSPSTNNLQHNLDRPQSHHHINIYHIAGPHCYTTPDHTGWSIAPWHWSSPSISITSVAGASFIISTLMRTPPGIVHKGIPYQWWWGTQWVKMKKIVVTLPSTWLTDLVCRSAYSYLHHHQRPTTEAAMPGNMARKDAEKENYW